MVPVTTNQQLNQGGTYQQACHFSIKMDVGISHGVKHRKLLISMMVLSRKIIPNNQLTYLLIITDQHEIC